MAELVYAFDLKSNGEIHMGSSPISGTRGYKDGSFESFFGGKQEESEHGSRISF